MHHTLRARTGGADKGLALLGGLGLGALLMYVFDPQRGARRRALVRDKAVAAYNRTGAVVSARTRDLRNRGKGIAVKTRSLLHDEEVSDEVLIERVRSRIGRVENRGTSVELSARGGVVTLSGVVSESAIDDLLEAVRSTPGVEDVQDRLETDDRADDETD